MAFRKGSERSDRSESDGPVQSTVLYCSEIEFELRPGPGSSSNFSLLASDVLISFILGSFIGTLTLFYDSGVYGLNATLDAKKSRSLAFGTVLDHASRPARPGPTNKGYA